MVLQLLFVLTAIIIGARLGGIGLGVMGGVGLGILTFVFGLQPTAPPIDVMLMIAAVISAASCMQAAGGLDLMVKWAEKLLRKNPSKITLLSPLVTYIFTFIAGTGHVAYSVLPVIAEVATETKIRPERPMAIAVIEVTPPSISASATPIGVVTDFGMSERVVASERPNRWPNRITLLMDTSEPTNAPSRMGSRLCSRTSSLR